MSRWIYGAGILGAALASSGPCAAQNMALTSARAAGERQLE